MGYLFPKMRLRALNGCISKIALYPHLLTIKDLDDLSNFLIFVNMNRIELLDASKEMSKDRLFKEQDRLFFESSINFLEYYINDVFNTFRDQFSKDHKIVGPFFSYVEPYIPYLDQSDNFY